MYSDEELAEYTQELRDQFCSRCIEKPPGGPPCFPLGKRCGVELELPQLINSVHRFRSEVMDLYIESFHGEVCPQCANRGTNQCPCPLDCLLLLAVQAIEAVDERRQHSIGEAVADLSQGSRFLPIAIRAATTVWNEKSRAEWNANNGLPPPHRPAEIMTTPDGSHWIRVRGS